MWRSAFDSNRRSQLYPNCHLVLLMWSSAYDPGMRLKIYNHVYQEVLYCFCTPLSVLFFLKVTGHLVRDFLVLEHHWWSEDVSAILPKISNIIQNLSIKKLSKSNHKRNAVLKVGFLFIFCQVRFKGSMKTKYALQGGRGVSSWKSTDKCDYVHTSY